LWWRELLGKEAFWGIAGALVGVTLGYSLTEVTRICRERRSRKTARRNLKDELHSNIFIIAQKQDVVRKMVAALEKQQVLPGRTTPCASIIYDTQIADIAKTLSSIERDNVHLIYAQLKDFDRYLNDFDRAVKEDLTLKVMDKPLQAHAAMLKDILGKYDVLRDLIGAFLKGHPEDVFYRHSGQAKPPTDFI
jgi:hypothetical protein